MTDKIILRIIFLRRIIIYSAIAYAFIAAIILLSYIPAFIAIPRESFPEFIQEQLLDSFAVSLLIFIVVSLLNLIGFRYTYKGKPLPDFISPIWAIGPYTTSMLCILLYYLEKPGYSYPSAIGEGVITTDIQSDTITVQMSYILFFTLGLISIKILNNLYVFIKNFYAAAVYLLDIKSDPINSNEKNTDPSGSLIDEAEKIANTYAKSDEHDKDGGSSQQLDIFIFTLNNVVVNGGHTIPFQIEEGLPIDEVQEGMFLHINLDLYIRIDHIMLFDFEKLYIVISPELINIIKSIKNNNIRKKINSYRFPGKPNGYFRIHPSVVSKLRKTMNRFTSPD